MRLKKPPQIQGPTTVPRKCPSNWKPDSERGTRQERGYDLQWFKLRKEFLARRPMCEQCWREGRRRLASQVDHIIPFNGLQDPLRLSMTNLQALCAPCHRLKTSSTSRVKK